MFHNPYPNLWGFLKSLPSHFSLTSESSLLRWFDAAECVWAAVHKSDWQELIETEERCLSVSVCEKVWDGADCLTIFSGSVVVILLFFSHLCLEILLFMMNSGLACARNIIIDFIYKSKVIYQRCWLTTEYASVHSECNLQETNSNVSMSPGVADRVNQ